MSHTVDRLIRIFEKSAGYCACCMKQLVFRNYGAPRPSRGRWEVGHSRSRADGGTNHFNNLWAFCVDCNRSMGTAPAAHWCAR